MYVYIFEHYGIWAGLHVLFMTYVAPIIIIQTIVNAVWKDRWCKWHGYKIELPLMIFWILFWEVLVVASFVCPKKVDRPFT